MKLPTDAEERKGTPIWRGFMLYFPRAIAAVAQLSMVGNEQHHSDKPLHWDKSKSTDELDSAARHMLDSGEYDVDRVLHDVKVAWRAMANLERLLESGKSWRLDDYNGALIQEANNSSIPLSDVKPEDWDKLK